jgi:hypothetical protein
MMGLWPRSRQLRQLHREGAAGDGRSFLWTVLLRRARLGGGGD